MTRKCVDKPPRKLINTVPSHPLRRRHDRRAPSRVLGSSASCGVVSDRKILGNAVRASTDCNELITMVPWCEWDKWG
jgi:hypothetical protein